MPYRIVERLQPVRKHAWLGYVAGLATFAVGFLLRYVPGSALDAVPFITLFPSILIAALIGGVRVGFAVAVLSFVAGWYFFLPPYNSFVASPQIVWVLLFFWITVAIQLYVVEALSRAVERLSVERDRADVLFRELQHRVANNMAFVASLLRLERKAVTHDPKNAAAILEQAQSRFDTMAGIHRRLYDPAIVDLPLATYLEGLVRDVLNAAGAPNIASVVEAAPAKLDLTRLVTLSLLINELITNSVKHGFKDRACGTITVRLERSGSHYVLTVEDDGKGVGTIEPVSDSLGMTIIRSLAVQLTGDIKWTGSAGTTTTLTFPA